MVVCELAQFLAAFTDDHGLAITMTSSLHHTSGRRAYALGLLLCLATCAVNAQTTIVVDTGGDPDPNSTRFTCTYRDDPDFLPASDRDCTLRRALVEAAARRFFDRPIRIEFDIPTSDPSYDAGLGVWTIETSQPLPKIRGENDSVESSAVEIAGPARSGVTGGPAVFVRLVDRLSITADDNAIRDIGFLGEASIFIQGDNNELDGIVMGLTRDGQSIALRTPANPVRGAFGIISISGHQNAVRNSVLTGAFARAVAVDFGAGNRIENNFIGTRLDGTVPDVPAGVECAESTNPNAADWLGGWGLSLAGSATVAIGNVIAGLQTARSPGSPRPTAIEVFGDGHVVSRNKIGIDAADNPVGVCGQAIVFSSELAFVDCNQIARPGALDDSIVRTAMLGIGTLDTSTINRNLIFDSPGSLLGYSPSADPGIRDFIPAQITSFEATAVAGNAGAGSPCPGCRIDFYLDNTDGTQDAFDWLGQTTAAGDGSFMFELSEEIRPGRGIRTTSTSTNAGVIPGQGAGATSRSSSLFPAGGNVDVVFLDGFE